MRRGIGVGIVLLLVLGLWPAVLSAQSQGTRSRPRAQVGQNYPNPFNPDTKASIELPSEFFEGGNAVRVSARIYNALQQWVATPKPLPLGQGGDAATWSVTTPGRFEVYWDGRDKNGNTVASGVYYLRWEVNGERYAPIKMVVAK